MTRKHTYISDHAVMRYMERAMGFDMNDIRERMHSDSLKAAIDAGANKVTIDGLEFLVREGRVITIWNKDAHGIFAMNKGIKAGKKRRANPKRTRGGSGRSKKRRG